MRCTQDSRRSAVGRRWWSGVFIALIAGVAAGRGAAAERPGAGPLGTRTNAPAGESRGWNLPYRKDGELKARLTGASARPLANGALEIRDLKVEVYRDGEPQAVLSTPLCQYREDVLDSTNSFSIQLTDNRGRLEGEGFHLLLAAKEVSSAGRFSANGAGGRLQLRGLGFHFRLEASQMVVSNQVQALLPIRLPKRLIP